MHPIYHDSLSTQIFTTNSPPQQKQMFMKIYFIEVFWFLGLQLQAEQPKAARAPVKKDGKDQKEEIKNTPQQDNYYSLLKALETKGLIERNLLMKRMEEKSLFGGNLKEGPGKSFQKKRARIYTKLNLEQKKYNLFREECEGYSKLITELL